MIDFNPVGKRGTVNGGFGKEGYCVRAGMGDGERDADVRSQDYLGKREAQDKQTSVGMAVHITPPNDLRYFSI
jgi:hypothetical protein